jgi:hypothetical protein
MDQNAVYEIALEWHCSRAALPTPLTKLARGLGACREIEYRGLRGCAESLPDQSLVLEETRPQRIAVFDGGRPRYPEYIGIDLCREHEGERHIVERALGVESLPHQDVPLAVREIAAQ